jgi:UDPglucose--hexose-1-phosphate uridylyltransferase
VPYAARAPYELRVLPRRHACAFEELSGSQAAELARLLRDLLGLLSKALGDPPYELVLHSAPNLQVKVLQGEWDTVARDYHWHLELTPAHDRRADVAGIAVNQTLPEEAAHFLRTASTSPHPAGKAGARPEQP